MYDQVFAVPTELPTEWSQVNRIAASMLRSLDLLENKNSIGDRFGIMTKGEWDLMKMRFAMDLQTQLNHTTEVRKKVFKLKSKKRAALAFSFL
jgi:hypothetical protein